MGKVQLFLFTTSSTHLVTNMSLTFIFEKKNLSLALLLLGFISFTTQSPAPWPPFGRKSSKKLAVEHSQPVDTSFSSPELGSPSPEIVLPPSEQLYGLLQSRQEEYIAGLDPNTLDSLQFEKATRPLRDEFDPNDQEAAKTLRRVIKNHLKFAGKSQKYITQVMDYTTAHVIARNRRRKAEEKKKDPEGYRPNAQSTNLSPSERIHKKISEAGNFARSMEQHGIALPSTALKLEEDTRVMIANHPNNFQLTRELYSYLEGSRFGADDIAHAKKERLVYNNKERYRRAREIELAKREAGTLPPKKKRVSKKKNDESAEDHHHSDHSHLEFPTYGSATPDFYSNPDTGSGHLHMDNSQLPYQYQQEYQQYQPSMHQPDYHSNYETGPSHHQQSHDNTPYQYQHTGDHHDYASSHGQNHNDVSVEDIMHNLYQQNWD